MTKVFWVDGSSSGNPGPGGFGVVELYWDSQLLNKMILNYCYQELFDDTTNNRMELAAILHVARLAKEDPDNEYIIFSDSMYSVQTINSWMRDWASKNWVTSRNRPVENQDLIKPIYELFNRPFFNCQVLKCRGHNNILGNEIADAVASNNRSKFDRLIDKNHIMVLDNPFY